MSHSFGLVSVGQFLFHLRLPSQGQNTISIWKLPASQLPGWVVGFLCFFWLTFQRYRALAYKTFLRKPHEWPSRWVGLLGVIHPEFLSTDSSRRFWPLLVFWNHRAVRDSNLSTQSHFGTHNQMSPGVTIACLWWKVPSSCSWVTSVICQLTWRENLETQQENGFLRHVKNIFTFVCT